MNIQPTVQAIIKFLQEITGVDIEKDIVDTSRFSGTLGDYELKRMLFSVYKPYKEGKHELAFYKANEVLSRLLLNNPPKDLSNLDEYISNLQEASVYLKLFREWEPEDKAQFQASFLTSDLFRPEDKTEENLKHLDRTILETTEKAFNERYGLRTFIRFRGSDLIPQNTKAAFNDNILIADSLTVLEQAVKTAASKATTNPVFTLLCKIEPIVDYSYFIIATSFKGTVWYTTDFIHFKNPYNAACRRNPRRVSENRENAIPLPYRVIDDVLEWRKSQEALPTIEGSKLPEFYIKNIFDYLPFESRCTLHLIFTQIYDTILTKGFDFEEIAPFMELMNKDTKLLGVQPTDNSDAGLFQDINTAKLTAYLNDLYIPESTSTELVPLTQAITTSEYANLDGLQTKHDYDTHVAWFKHEQIRKQKQRALSDFYETHSAECFRRMEELLVKHKDSLLKFATLAKKVYFASVDGGYLYEFASIGEQSWASPVRVSRIRDRVNYCAECNRFHVKTPLVLHFLSYHQLMMILGVTREELPEIFRNYKIHSFVPYIGNTLLDNVNPEFQIFDPLSEKWKNGLRFEYYICGKCLRPLYYKSKYDEIVIFYSDEQQKILGVTSHDEYTKVAKECNYDMNKIINLVKLEPLII